MLDALIQDLEALRGGTLTGEEFSARHPHRADTSDLEEVLCNLEHFLADEDIRARDLGYAAFQTAELDKLIRHLRAQDWRAATQVSFLRATS
jgi:hypothetical protein